MTFFAYVQSKCPFHDILCTTLKRDPGVLSDTPESTYTHPITQKTPVAQRFWKALCAWFAAVLWEEQERLILWTPICIGLGIACYFSSSTEPTAYVVLFLCVCMGVCLTTFSLSRFYGLRTLCMALLLSMLGFSIAWWRTHHLNTPMLQKPLHYVVFKGQIKNIDLKRTKGKEIGATVILKVHAHVARSHGKKHAHHQHAAYKKGTFAPKGTFVKNVRLKVLKGWQPLCVGDTIRVFGSLHSIPGPVWPHGFSMRRQFFFQNISATGIALGAPQILHKASPQKWKNSITRLRTFLETTFHATLTPHAAAIACALILGETGGITTSLRAAFSASGIAHLLAVSGLHMSVIATLMFLLFRHGFALFPKLALRCATHKLAAFASMVAAYGYLHLSGMRVPAMRAFIMTCVVMLGLCIGRSPFTLRVVAAAASCLLLLQPEVLLSISFQLSFAAVTALVAWGEWQQQHRQNRLATNGFVQKIFKHMRLLSLSSVVAGFATMPFTASVFFSVPLLGNLLNMLAIPLTVLILMPLCVLFVFLTPLGCHTWLAWPLNSAFGFLIQAASFVASQPWAMIPVALGHTWAMPMIILAGLWVLLWSGRLRWLGLPFLCIGLIGLLWPHPPAFLMDGNGKTIGYYARDARTLWVLDKRRGTFAHKVWKNITGAQHVRTLPFGSIMNATHAKPKTVRMTCDHQSCFFKTPQGITVVLAKDGEKAPFADAVHLLLSREPLEIKHLWRSDEDDPLLSVLHNATQLRLGRFHVWRFGAIALWPQGNTFKVSCAKHGEGVRPWTAYPQFRKTTHKKTQSHTSLKRSKKKLPKQSFCTPSS